MIKNISRVSKYLFFFSLLLIVVFSSLPRFNVGSYEVSEGLTLRLDYLLHFLAYFAMTGFYILWRGKDGLRSVVVILLLGGIIAYMTEFQQQFITGRTYNPVDGFFNLSGAFVGVLVTAFLKKLVFDREE